jgi:hypothetical protein
VLDCFRMSLFCRELACISSSLRPKINARPVYEKSNFFELTKNTESNINVYIFKQIYIYKEYFMFNLMMLSYTPSVHKC